MIQSRRVNRLALFLVVGTTMSVAAVLWLVLSRGDGKQPLPGVQAAFQSGDPADTFAVLRRARTASDDFPAGASNQLEGPAATFGWRLADARRLTGATSQATWLVQGSSDLCLVYSEGSGFGWTCQPTGQATAGHLGGRTVADDGGVLRSLVPDSTTNLRMVHADGTSSPADAGADGLVVAAGNEGDRLEGDVGGKEQMIAG